MDVARSNRSCNRRLKASDAAGKVTADLAKSNDSQRRVYDFGHLRADRLPRTAIIYRPIRSYRALDYKPSNGAGTNVGVVGRRDEARRADSGGWDSWGGGSHPLPTS